jgi:dTDP-4-amino-4,6-dideoxygalactose transaminase
MAYRVPFLDLKIKNKFAFHRALDTVMSHGQFVLGPEVELLEDRLSSYVNRKFCVSVSSGSDALLLAIRSLSLNPGDEIITTPLSWIATANAIVLSGAIPVFADIDESLNIDPDSIIPMINNKTKAILSVDFTGKLCRYEELLVICKAFGLVLIEDGSQSFGASNNSGQRCGKFGTLSAISHNPMKVLGAFGEAGSIYTDCDELYERLKLLRYAGTVNREICTEHSLNHRMDTINAAFLLHRLEQFENEVVARRQANAEIYARYLPQSVNRSPSNVQSGTHVFYTYTVLLDDREGLMKWLSANSIETKVQHRTLMPDQPAFREFRRYQNAQAASIADKILCLPIGEHLSESQIMYVCEKINHFYS